MVCRCKVSFTFPVRVLYTSCSDVRADCRKEQSWEEGEVVLGQGGFFQFSLNQLFSRQSCVSLGVAESVT